MHYPAQLWISLRSHRTSPWARYSDIASCPAWCWPTNCLSLDDFRDRVADPCCSRRRGANPVRRAFRRPPGASKGGAARGLRRVNANDRRRVPHARCLAVKPGARPRVRPPVIPGRWKDTWRSPSPPTIRRTTARTPEVLLVPSSPRRSTFRRSTCTAADTVGPGAKYAATPFVVVSRRIEEAPGARREVWWATTWKRS